MNTEACPPEIAETEWAVTLPAVRQLVVAQQAAVADWRARSAHLQAELTAVQTENAQLRAAVYRLEGRLQAVEARLKQTSRTSSRPPSSDPPSAPPRPPRPPSGRRRGGQPGHAGHGRTLLPPDEVDELVPLYPTQCQACGHALPADQPTVVGVSRRQIWDSPPQLVTVTEYQQHTVACPHCQHHQAAPLPADLPPGAFGPGIVALTALLQRFRLSDRETVAFWQTAAGLPISLGSIPALCGQMSEALAAADAAIHQHLQRQATVHVDETSWREANQPSWLWTATTPQATCFRIQRRRNRAAFATVLDPAFRGVLVSDRYCVYRQVPSARRQVCWAHLVRNLRGCLERTPAGRTWAQAVLAELRAIFQYWHWFRDAHLDRVHLQVLTAPHREAIWVLLDGPPLDHRPAETLRCALRREWETLWTFIRVEDVEPTNNAAERVLRPAVLWRKGCFGTQSAGGSRFAERLLSVVTTATQQGQDVLAFLRSAIAALWSHQPSPVLALTN